MLILESCLMQLRFVRGAEEPLTSSALSITSFWITELLVVLNTFPVWWVAEAPRSFIGSMTQTSYGSGPTRFGSLLLFSHSVFTSMVEEGYRQIGVIWFFFPIGIDALCYNTSETDILHKRKQVLCCLCNVFINLYCVALSHISLRLEYKFVTGDSQTLRTQLGLQKCTDL